MDPGVCRHCIPWVMFLYERDQANYVIEYLDERYIAHGAVGIEKSGI